MFLPKRQGATEVMNMVDESTLNESPVFASGNIMFYNYLSFF